MSNMIIITSSTKNSFIKEYDTKQICDLLENLNQLQQKQLRDKINTQYENNITVNILDLLDESYTIEESQVEKIYNILSRLTRQEGNLIKQEQKIRKGK